MNHTVQKSVLGFVAVPYIKQRCGIFAYCFVDGFEQRLTKTWTQVGQLLLQHVDTQAIASLSCLISRPGARMIGSQYPSGLIIQRRYKTIIKHLQHELPISCCLRGGQPCNADDLAAY